MKTRWNAAIAAIVIAASAGTASAFWDWADEFTSTTANLELVGSSGQVWISHRWDGISTYEERQPWEPVGGQSISGRFNSREQVMYEVLETYPSACITVTAELARWRDPTPPAQGSTCNSGSTSGNLFLGSSAWTVNTCGGGNADPTYVRRNRPEFNFASESGQAVGSVPGYISRLRHFTDGANQMPDILELFGCYKIWWWSV